MAISLSLDTDYGVPASYHRITGMQFYYNDWCVDVTVMGYVNQTARQHGRQPVTVHSIRVPLDEVGDEPCRAAIYAAIKAMPRFAGAVDC